MSDKRKSDYECEMCKRVMHIGPCPHNRRERAEELVRSVLVSRSQYEALLNEALKLEAALAALCEVTNGRNMKRGNMLLWSFGITSDDWANALEALAQFKKWRGGE